MSRISVLVILLAIMVCILATTVTANRLITIPTGNTLTTGGIKLEYAANSSSDEKVYWANVGVSRLEVEGARFDGFDTKQTDAISVQVSAVPETSFTPAVALGVRDISDQTKNKGLFYDGTSYYLAVSKTVPVTGGIPILFQNARVHAGIGTGSLSGVFFGVEGTLPMGLNISGEYDTSDFNFAASYNIVPTIKAKASWIKGDFFYGATFATAY